MFSINAKWIQCPESISSPCIIKKVNINEFDSANIKITGLGFYELFINGKRITNNFYKPCVSDYIERDFSKFSYPLKDKTSHTIYYNSFNISKYLKKGENIIFVLLGNGYFKQKMRLPEGDTSFGDSLISIFDIKVLSKCKESHFYTDGTEIVLDSFIKENNLFYGEKHDYNGYKDFFALSDFSNYIKYKPKIIQSPKAKFCLQRTPFDVVVKTIKPKIIFSEENKTVFDVGENITGFVEIVANDNQILVNHAENIKGNRLDYFSAGGEEQISSMSYLNVSNGQTLHPWFTWSAFRYFEVVGQFNDVTVKIVNANIKNTSFFNSGSENLNWLYNAYVRTQLNNMHCGMPLDCPHRERLGYTGDGQITSETAMLLFNCKNFYYKWIQDIIDCQDIETGHVQHTAPFFGGGGGPLGWGGAIVIVPYNYYKIYGDVSIIKKTFKPMLRFIDSIKSFCENGLVVKERDGGWCLGDWCTPSKCEIPEPFVNTCLFIYCLNLIEEMAKVIGENFSYNEEKDKSILALKEKFYDAINNTYCDGIQGADAFAMFAGIADKGIEKSIIKKYSSLKAFDTGILGTPILADCLIKTKNLKLLFEILSSNKFPSFGYMREQGASTLWELWSGELSQNHPMFGGIVKYLFYGFLGLRFDVGCKKIVIQPNFIEELKFVEGTLKISGGVFYVKQTFFADKTIINIVNNTNDTIYVSCKNDFIKCEENSVKEITISKERINYS